MKKVNVIVSKILIFVVCFSFMATIFNACKCSADKPKYEISFYVDDKVYSTIKTSGYEILTLPIVPEKNGYEFLGWYFDKNTWQLSLTEYSYRNNPLKENVSVYAHYEKNEEEHNIIFVVNLQTIKTIKTSGNELLVLPSAPIKQGYEFKGWYFDKDVWQNKLTEDYYENIALTGDVRVYAYYVKQNVEPTKYLVTFETNGGTIIQPITTSLIEASPKTTKQNANFVGWYLDASFTQPVTFPFEVTRQVTLYAKWEEMQPYAISFFADEQIVQTIKTFGNEVFVLPSAPIKQGYEFKGWYFDKDVWQNKLTEDYYENVALTSNVSVYAYYEKENVEPTKYLVTFETNGGTIIQPITTSLIETSPKTTKQNANFVGWYLDASFTQPVTFPFEVTRK